MYIYIYSYNDTFVILNIDYADKYITLVIRRVTLLYGVDSHTVLSYDALVHVPAISYQVQYADGSQIKP